MERSLVDATRWLRSRACIGAAALVATGCGGAPGAGGSPSAVEVPVGFDVRPGTVLLSGEPIEITVKGLASNAEVEIVAERVLTTSWPKPGRALYRARATFTTDPTGAVDLASARPLSGSYDRADVRGLFWSMTRTQERPPQDWPGERVKLVASTRGRAAAEVTLTVRQSDPRVEVTEVGAEFPGAALARLPGPAGRPAIIVLGGSDGGDWAATEMAPRLASHGYAVMGLPYYAPAWAAGKALKDLPAAFVDIPVGRLERAYTWLRRQPGVDGERIGVYGVSKGGEFALIAASRVPWIDAVVAIVPSDVVWEGWGLPGQAPGTRSSFSWRGQPLPFVPYKDFQAELEGYRTGAEVRLRRSQDAGRAENPQAVVKARIPIENYRGALLVAGGDQDQVWASGPMVRNIAARRAEAGLATTSLVYPDAGHLLSGDGWSPTTEYDAGNVKVGGTAAGNAGAQAEIWRATLSLLAQALRPVTAGGRPTPDPERRNAALDQ